MFAQCTVVIIIILGLVCVYTCGRKWVDEEWHSTVECSTYNHTLQGWYNWVCEREGRNKKFENGSLLVCSVMLGCREKISPLLCLLLCCSSASFLLLLRFMLYHQASSQCRDWLAAPYYRHHPEQPFFFSQNLVVVKRVNQKGVHYYYGTCLPLNDEKR